MDGAVIEVRSADEAVARVREGALWAAQDITGWWLVGQFAEVLTALEADKGVRW